MTLRHTRYQAVVLRDDNCLLLVRCIFADGRDWWMFPGGGREEGESEEACVIREMREETGLDVDVERMLLEQLADPPDGMYTRWRTYLCRVVAGDAAPGGGEGDGNSLVEVMWLPLFDECAWPTVIQRDPFLYPQLQSFRAALMPPARAVLFDLDDTLLDRRRSLSHYFAAHAGRVGLSVAMADEFRARFFELEAAGYAPRAPLFDQLSAEFPAAGSGEALLNDWRTCAWEVCHYMEGATDVLAWCRTAGFRTAILTNGRADFQSPKLDRLRVAALVDHVIISGDEGIHKPDAELFRRVAERLDVAVSECVFVGDHPRNDIAGAEGAGMRAIWFERDIEWPAGVARPTHSIRHLGALQRILRRVP